MPIKINELVKDILLEQLPQNSSIKSYITNLLQNNTNYSLALRDAQADATTKFTQLKDIAHGLNTGGSRYAGQDELNNNRAFLPILDFLSVYVYPYFRRNPTAFDKALNVSIADFLEADIPQDQRTIFNTKLNQLANPQNYQITDRNILKVIGPKKRLSDLRYENKTPLDAILSATREIGGYKEKEVLDIMKYPREYDIQGKITKRELQPIQEISAALYFFYTERIKHPTYISVLRNIGIPNLQNNTDQQIESVIDASVGTRTPQNNAFQADYEAFLNGKSRFLVQLTEEGLNTTVDDILSEVMRGIYGGTNIQVPKTAPSGYKPAIATGFGVNKPAPTATPNNKGRYQPPKPPQSWQVKPNQPQTNQPQQTDQPTQQKTIKPTKTPFITTIKDFSRPGISGDQNVQNAFSNFFNFLTKGTAPSTGEKVLKGMDYIDRAAGAIGNWMSGWKAP
jgi:hypothetical protein